MRKTALFSSNLSTYSYITPYISPTFLLQEKDSSNSCCMSSTTGKVLARPWEGPGEGESPKRARFGRCFSSLEFKMEARPLKDLDSEKLKKELRRWAKAVVAYARQLSGSFSSRERSSES